MEKRWKVTPGSWYWLSRAEGRRELSSAAKASVASLENLCVLCWGYSLPIS